MKKKLALLLAAVSVLALLAACSARYCHVDGCKNPVYSSFYCAKHGCKVKDCKEKAVKDGYCDRHYEEAQELSEAGNGAAETPAPGEEPEAPSEAPSEEPMAPCPDFTGHWVYHHTIATADGDNQKKGDEFEYFMLMRDDRRSAVDFYADGTADYYDGYNGETEHCGCTWTGEVYELRWEGWTSPRWTVRYVDENTIRFIGGNIDHIFTRG